MTDRILQVALGNSSADLLLKNGRIVDVLTETIYEANVAIVDGIIAGVGDYTEGQRVIDLDGAYVCPGLINAHCHVESSMARPEAYCAEELRWGTTTLITDPHEIANVAGGEGIRYMLEAGSRMPVNYYVELPSCVPATPFEHAGCVMDAAAMAELMDLPGVLGMGEMMNVPGVLFGDEQVQAKLELFRKAGRIIDGHAPSVVGRQLQAYAGAGVATDHESVEWSEALAKLRSGMAVLVREGSASKNLDALIQGVLADKVDIANLAFCTDDKHLADMRKEGTIRHCVCKAIALGMEPVRALRMATINAARIYGLRHLGAVAAGKQADIVAFEDLESLVPRYVFHKGADAWQNCEQAESVIPVEALRGSVKPASFTENDFSAEKFVAGTSYPVIEMLPGQIITERGKIDGGEVAAKLAAGELYMIAVLERHHGTGNMGLGLLRGYGLTSGAVATTVAHDSHNLIVLGTNSADMALAAKELVRVQGGYTLVQDGRVIDTLSLDICGLMSTLPTETLIDRLEEIQLQAHALGVGRQIDPFISLSFMALPVIPKIRITDMGMFDAESFKFLLNA